MFYPHLEGAVSNRARERKTLRKVLEASAAMTNRQITYFDKACTRKRE
jgi:hypothetical protein